jgi:hypothetical protein
MLWLKSNAKAKTVKLSPKLWLKKELEKLLFLKLNQRPNQRPTARLKPD